MRGARRFFVAALGLVAAVVVVVTAAWAFDTRSDDEVARNVTLAGRDVSGLTRAELTTVVREIARRYGETAVFVDAPGGGFSMPPSEIGLTVDEQATVDAVLAVGRKGGVVGRIGEWMRSFLDPRRAPVSVDAEEAAVYRVVAARDAARTPPTEPSVKAEKGRLVAVEGAPGSGIDPAAVLRALPGAARDGTPVTVEVGRGSIPPRFPIDEAERAVTRGEEVTAKPLAVTVDGEAAEVGTAALRSWLRTEPTDSGLRLVLDGERASAGLGELLPDAGTPAVETRFEVVNDAPQIVPGTAGTACCAPEAGLAVAGAIQARLANLPGAEPVSLAVKPLEPELTAEEAAALGIKEPVGSFTTNFAPNQSRVTNIHRIADLVRGQVILPGRTFSVNGFVGERTAEKGFVMGGVIEDGKFTESLGGGISQFATTTFNAAFFAGLEFAEYQSHSIYISRYPFGREATLSYPKPDLKIRNPSPHGVLIWPSYTGRSITVTLYSTRWADVAQTNQTTEPRGPCTRVRTERTRRFLADGTTKIDHVNALYRPEEGVNCT